MERLKGKRALITGGTTGIGLETAREFIQEGARVMVTGSRAESVGAVRSEFPDAVVSNAGDSKAQRALASEVQQRFGGLDILVVNAGIVEMKTLEQWTEDAYDHSFNVNLKGPFFLIQAMLPLFANPASIVLTGSVNAHIGMPGTSVYGASKAGLISLARTLSGELVPRGIRINVVSPGPIATPLYDKLGMTPEMRKGLTAQVPVGRFGTDTEVARAIVYFASDESAFTVGSELILDGGMTTL